jgi:hypothetical protein
VHDICIWASVVVMRCKCIAQGVGNNSINNSNM